MAVVTVLLLMGLLAQLRSTPSRLPYTTAIVTGWVGTPVPTALVDAAKTSPRQVEGRRDQFE